MNCPKCGSCRTGVTNTAKDASKVLRIRECKKCGERFCTTEKRDADREVQR